MSSSEHNRAPLESYKDAKDVAEDRAQKEAVRKKVAIAREILSDKNVPKSVVEKDNEKFGREASIVMTIFALLVAGVLITWYLWDGSFLQNEEDLVYNLGLIGGIMMLLQFVYSARKRSAKMRRWGKLKVWFGVHTFIGLSAPLLIIIHSRFEIQSINGGVAFFSMLIVVISGVIGRYLYSQVNFDLSAGRSQLKALHQEMQERVLLPNRAVAPAIEKPLKGFMITAFSTPDNIIRAFLQAMSVGFKSKTLYLQLSQLKFRQLAVEGQYVPGGDVLVFGDLEKRILKNYLGLLSKMARYNAYKQLFSYWRIGHVPLIYLLLFTGLAHVLAVHMY